MKTTPKTIGRDIKIAKSFPGPGELSVEDVMTPDPFVVGPNAFLDALRVLNDVLQNNYSHKAA